MIDKINFLYDEKGYNDELRKKKEIKRKLLIINGNDKKAFDIAYERLEHRKKSFMENMESNILDILLSERVINELFEEFKSNGKL